MMMVPPIELLSRNAITLKVQSACAPSLFALFAYDLLRAGHGSIISPICHANEGVRNCGVLP
jgi:hypothetical protein